MRQGGELADDVACMRQQRVGIQFAMTGEQLRHRLVQDRVELRDELVVGVPGGTVRRLMGEPARPAFDGERQPGQGVAERAHDFSGDLGLDQMFLDD